MTFRTFFTSVYQSVVQWQPTWGWPWGSRRQIIAPSPLEHATDIEEKVKKDWEENGVWIDRDCFFGCWDKIWEWIDVGALRGQMMKHGLLRNQDDLFWIDGAKSPRERADNLLHRITPRLGQYGYYLLYMCIRDDEENPHGHGDAVKELVRCAKQHLTQPTWFSTCDRPTSVDVTVSDDRVTTCTDGSHSRPTVHTNGHIMESMTPEQAVQDPSQDTAATLLEVREREPIASSVVEAQVKEKESKFRNLVRRTYRYLEKALTDLNDFKVSVTVLPASYKKDNIIFAGEDLRSIANATKLVQIFCILNKYWDWFHYELLEAIVNDYGSDRLKRKVDEYRKEMERFANALPLRHFSRHRFSNDLENSIPLSVRIRGDFYSYTLEHARQQQRDLAKEYDLQPYTLRLSTAEPSSVLLTFLVPSAVVGDMIIKSPSMYGYFSEHNIFQLTIGEMCIYSNSRHGNTTIQSQPEDSEVDELRQENERLEAKHAELEANIQLFERERSVEGSSYFELDAYQLLNEDEHLQMRIGNFLERMNKDDTPYWELLLQQAKTDIEMDSLLGMTPDQKLLAVVKSWSSSAGTVTVIMFCRACWRAGALLAGDALEEMARRYMYEGESSQISDEEPEQENHTFIDYFRFSEHQSI